MGMVTRSSSSVRPPRRRPQIVTGCDRDQREMPSLSGSQCHTYALVGRQDLEYPSDIVPGIFSVISYDMYAPIESGPTLSYITPDVMIVLR